MFHAVIPAICCSALLSALSSVAVAAGPVIGHLETRDYRITITSHNREPQYIISTKEGSRVAADLSQKELKTQYPDVYRKLRSAVADYAPDRNNWAGQ